MGTGNTWRRVSSSVGESTNMTDKWLLTEHQGGRGKNTGEKPLWSNLNRWELSEPISEDICTRQTDSIPRVPKRDNRWGVELSLRHSTSGRCGQGE